MIPVMRAEVFSFLGSWFLVLGWRIDDRVTLWECPTMPEFRKLDSKRRAIFPSRFSPGDLFVEEEIGNDRVVFRLIKAVEAPLVEVEFADGILMVQAKVNSQTIREAIRADRDAR
jgi:hypothetical protein